jgi:hypothetical protein
MQRRASDTSGSSGLSGGSFIGRGEGPGSCRRSNCETAQDAKIDFRDPRKLISRNHFVSHHGLTRTKIFHPCPLFGSTFRGGLEFIDANAHRAFLGRALLIPSTNHKRV